MTCRELLQMLQTRLDNESQIEETDIKMIVRGDSKNCTARIMIPIEDKIKIVEIKAKEICVYDGL